MKFKVLTPNNVLIDKSDVDYVQVFVESGAMGILPGHSPFIGRTIKSKIKYIADKNENYVDVENGFVIVNPDSVEVFFETSEQR